MRLAPLFLLVGAALAAAGCADGGEAAPPAYWGAFRFVPGLDTKGPTPWKVTDFEYEIRITVPQRGAHVLRVAGHVLGQEDTTIYTVHQPSGAYASQPELRGHSSPLQVIDHRVTVVSDETATTWPGDAADVRLYLPLTPESTTAWSPLYFHKATITSDDANGTWEMALTDEVLADLAQDPYSHRAHETGVGLRHWSLAALAPLYSFTLLSPLALQNHTLDESFNETVGNVSISYESHPATGRVGTRSLPAHDINVTVDLESATVSAQARLAAAVPVPLSFQMQADVAWITTAGSVSISMRSQGPQVHGFLLWVAGPGDRTGPRPSLDVALLPPLPERPAWTPLPCDASGARPSYNAPLYESLQGRPVDIVRRVAEAIGTPLVSTRSEEVPVGEGRSTAAMEWRTSRGTIRILPGLDPGAPVRSYDRIEIDGAHWFSQADWDAFAEALGMANITLQTGSTLQQTVLIPGNQYPVLLQDGYLHPGQSMQMGAFRDVQPLESTLSLEEAGARVEAYVDCVLAAEGAPEDTFVDVWDTALDLVAVDDTLAYRIRVYHGPPDVCNGYSNHRQVHVDIVTGAILGDRHEVTCD